MPALRTPLSALPTPLPALLTPRPAFRPHALLPLYATFAAVQALDYVTTTRALANGTGREANPIMGAIVLMAVADGAMVAIVTHNATVR